MRLRSLAFLYHATLVLPIAWGLPNTSPALAPYGPDAPQVIDVRGHRVARELGEPRYIDEDYSVADVLQERDYKPSKPKCHPHTVTKYRTVFKDRKANVFNKVEVRNPRPQVHKTKETRHTTIRYPVFITQVIKPLLTQVETKVKPMFFTKTLKRVKTIVFTVTGIGQVTVTSVKYEKEYVTRCQKKKKPHHYRRRQDLVDQDGEPLEAGDEEPAYADSPDYPSGSVPSYATQRLSSYEDIYRNRYKRDVVDPADGLAPSLVEISPSKASLQITDPLPGQSSQML